jgi:chromosome segregation ATPase
LNNWKRKRAEAAIGDDEEKFDEMHAQVQKAEESLRKAQEKLDKTEASFETERVAREHRQTQEAADAALADFETRSGERKTQLEGLNATHETARDDLESNLTEIETLQEQLNDDPDNATLQGEL